MQVEPTNTGMDCRSMDELMVVYWPEWGLPNKLRFGVPAGGSESGPPAIYRGAAKITSLSWNSIEPIRDSSLASRCIAVTRSAKRKPAYFINCGWICSRPIEPPRAELVNLPL